MKKIFAFDKDTLKFKMSCKSIYSKAKIKANRTISPIQEKKLLQICGSTAELDRIKQELESQSQSQSELDENLVSE